MPLSKEARAKLVDNVCAGCPAEKRAKYEGLEDEVLQTVSDSVTKNKQMELVANAAKKGFTDPGGNTHTWNEEKGEWEMKPAAPAPESKTDNSNGTPAKPQTTKEWLDSAPEEVRNTFKYAQQVELKEKGQLIANMTSHIEDEAAKKAAITRLSKMSIEDLQALAPIGNAKKADDSDGIDATLAHYIGAATPVGNTSGGTSSPAVDRSAILPLPKMDWSDEKQAS